MFQFQIIIFQLRVKAATFPDSRKVTFINYTSTELEKQENTSIKLLDFNHKLLSLYVGLSTKMSQAELKMLQTTERLARL